MIKKINLIPYFKQILTLSILLTTPSIYAASCESAATVTTGIWDQYRKSVESLGCRTKLGGATEYLICGSTRLFNESIEDMVGWWNSGAKNRWSTIGPRMLGAEIEYGTVVKLTKRTFVSMVPSFNTGKIVVKGKAGTGKVTICATDDKGKTTKLFNDVEVKGHRNFNISRKNAEGKVLAVVLQSKSASFKYEVEKTEEPLQWNFGAIKGLADLHVHGAAQEGFAGLWTWGDNDGSRDDAHKRCRALNVLDAGSVIAQLGSLSVLEKSKLHAIPLNWDKHEKEEVVRHGSGWSNGVDKYDDWPHFSDIAHQQVHTDWLKDAHKKGLKLVVMSAVNNELLCRGLRAGLYQGDNKYACDDMSNIERQLNNFNALDKKYDWYEIALTPWHARKIIHENKLAVVLSAESSHMLPPSEGAFQTQLEKFYQLGLRSLQIVHERDNSFAGAAPHRSNFWWHQRTSNPLTSFKAMLDGDGEKNNPFDLDARGKNVKGLSKKGEKLIDAMIQRRMLIDTSHFSEKTFKDVFNLVTNKKYKNYPLYNSHSRFKTLLEEPERDTLKEFLTTDEQIDMLNKVGGILGVRTGPNAIASFNKSRVANNCAGSSRSYAQMVAYAKSKNLNIAFGSDFNGVTQQLGPRYGDERCYAAVKTGRQKHQMQQPEPANFKINKNFDNEGLKHIGYLPDLYSDLNKLNTLGAAELNGAAENFIVMWEKAYGEDIKKTVNSKSACQVDSDCKNGNQYCDKGGVLGVGKNVCLTKSLSIGKQCVDNKQCSSGSCNKDKVCQCTEDKHCGDGQRCDKGGLLGVGKNSCSKVIVPSCKNGWKYEIRNPLNKDRCNKTSTKSAALKCRLLVTDKAKNWTGPHAQKGADECRSKKGKKPKGVKCPSGYKYNSKSGKDTCTKTTQEHETPTCPALYDYKSLKGKDECRKK